MATKHDDTMASELPSDPSLRLSPYATANGTPRDNETGDELTYSPRSTVPVIRDVVCLNIIPRTVDIDSMEIPALRSCKGDASAAVGARQYGASYLLVFLNRCLGNSHFFAY